MHLVAVLSGFGIRCDTAGNRGWKSLSNGDLVAAAVKAGFRCMLMRERLFGESASRALKSYSQFAVVVIDLPQQRWPEYRERFIEQWTKRPIEPIASQLVHWP